MGRSMYPTIRSYHNNKDQNKNDSPSATEFGELFVCAEKQFMQQQSTTTVATC